MATLQSLLEQKSALDEQIKELQEKTRSDAIDKITALMQENGLTVADLSPRKAFSSGGKTAKPVKKVQAKYKDAKTGQTWSGRGLKPKWLAAAVASGKKIEDFLIKS